MVITEKLDSSVQNAGGRTSHDGYWPRHEGYKEEHEGEKEEHQKKKNVIRKKCIASDIYLSVRNSFSADQKRVKFSLY